MKTLYVLVLFGVTLLSSTSCAEDAYEKARRKLTESKCVSFEFLSIIESDIFDTVDSTSGTAWFSHDGKYLLNFGADQYLYDLERLYSYSYENNQVTVENISNGDGTAAISFIVHLEDFYEHTPVVADHQYQLHIRDSISADIPDSLTLSIGRNTGELETVEFYDINEELNRIRFLKQNTSDTCDSLLFIPGYPDSVETIRLW